MATAMILISQNSAVTGNAFPSRRLRAGIGKRHGSVLFPRLFAHDRHGFGQELVRTGVVIRITALHRLGFERIDLGSIGCAQVRASNFTMRRLVVRG